MRLFLCLAALCFLISFSFAGERNVIFRGQYHNSMIQFLGNKDDLEKNGRVAFMGGSITQMNGYRPMVSNWLKARFPQTEFDFINAGISSTCSMTGAFRLKEHVLNKGRVDLFFIEFAVNDDQDAGHEKRECVRGMEGIIRHARTEQPEMDIVVTYFVNPGMLDQLKAGKIPMPIAAHEEVLKHYGVSAIFLAREVAERIGAGELTWAQFGGTHPKPAGNAIAAEMIGKLLSSAWDKNKAKVKVAHQVPEKLIDTGSYYQGKFLSPEQSVNDSWSWSIPQWNKIPGSFRNTFAGMKLFCCDEAGKETVVRFTGTALGAYVLAGPDAGTLEFSLDDGPWKTLDLYHRYSRGLHYPRTLMLVTDLEKKEHTVRMRLSDKSNPSSKGTAARILQFTVN
jgi:lysophospholipase L1-like esterase|tara:strand:- start:721 stop:1905 length:1185 start_codon:yes stop_codon:yes gene_type:complete